MSSFGRRYNVLKMSVPRRHQSGDAHGNREDAHRTRGCVFPQVDSFDPQESNLTLLAPKLPLPDALLEGAMRSALASGQGALNHVLQENPLCLPDGVAKYLIPPPTRYSCTAVQLYYSTDHQFIIVRSEF